jgi:hypothetical protein
MVNVTVNVDPTVKVIELLVSPDEIESCEVPLYVTVVVQEESHVTSMVTDAACTVSE